MTSRSVRGIAVLLSVALAASTLATVAMPAAPAAASERVKPRPRPGPIPRGFEGMAYPVPRSLVPGAHVNDVAVTVHDASGARAGRGYVPAGTAVEVKALEDHPDTVVLAWPGDRTARAPRSRFWAVPSFIELRDMKVPVDGREVLLGESGIGYHRGGAAYFDDPHTPGYDGTTILTNREFLECKRDTWGMGGQTFAVDAIEDGLHRHDRTLMDEGVKAVDWGVAVPINGKAVHELHRDCDGKTVADYGYTHHTTQWLESLGRTVYLLVASPWAGEYRPKIDAYVERVNKIATLETKPANWDYWDEHVEDAFGNDFTHRTFMMAAALGLASTLADHHRDEVRWKKRAAEIAHRGVDNQLPNGVNPERAGFDVLYQMYGTWLLELYFSTLGHRSAWRTEVEHTIDKATHWMAGRIKPDTGQIRIRGTTRICVEVLWSRGSPAPNVETGEIVRAFLLWGLLRSDPKLVALAQKVDQGDKRYGNPCPADYYAKPEPRAGG